ncbi:hypothetical protein BDE02_01G174300 [Populus trichocarpa]|nr:hypothetical protein BDE02_01G174300 [Populus trichocarpa]
MKCGERKKKEGDKGWFHLEESCLREDNIRVVHSVTRLQLGARHLIYLGNFMNVKIL